MKHLLTILLFFQISCFSQDKDSIVYQKLDTKDYYIEETHDYLSKFIISKKVYESGHRIGTEDANLKKGNYILHVKTSYMKFSINEKGNIDGKLDVKETRKRKTLIFNAIIKNGLLQSKKLLDTIGNLINETNRYYYKDSIQEINISNTGIKISKVKYPSGKSIIKKYDKDGKFLDKTIEMSVQPLPR
ncbi:hypothetical protein [Flavobacterium sp.]|uniref:hypothetical protein n=1 Tax=Flavobacterium sp. TaxID=239 RepID=UPI00286A096E|nr:hypothetical protein [Flavobacterium sp.]